MAIFISTVVSNKKKIKLVLDLAIYISFIITHCNKNVSSWINYHIFAVKNMYIYILLN